MEDMVLQEFKRLFREADFQHLIKMGAPLDEYDNEALSLYTDILPQDSIIDIQKKIWGCFYNSFCVGISCFGEKHYMFDDKGVEECIGTLDTYKEIAEKIKKIIG